MSEQSADLPLELSRRQVGEDMTADPSVSVDEERLWDLTDVERPCNIAAVVDEKRPRRVLLLSEPA